MLAPGVLYAHPWRVSRGFDASVGRALDAALGPAEAPPWQRIVLDLRLNDGGEYPMVYSALKRLPSRLARELLGGDGLDRRRRGALRARIEPAPCQAEERGGEDGAQPHRGLIPSGGAGTAA